MLFFRAAMERGQTFVGNQDRDERRLADSGKARDALGSWGAGEGDSRSKIKSFSNHFS